LLARFYLRAHGTICARLLPPSLLHPYARPRTYHFLVPAPPPPLSPLRDSLSHALDHFLTTNAQVYGAAKQRPRKIVHSSIQTPAMCPGADSRRVNSFPGENCAATLITYYSHCIFHHYQHSATPPPPSRPGASGRHRTSFVLFLPGGSAHGDAIFINEKTECAEALLS
jgi:hypothetical protein